MLERRLIWISRYFKVIGLLSLLVPLGLVFPHGRGSLSTPSAILLGVGGLGLGAVLFFAGTSLLRKRPWAYWFCLTFGVLLIIHPGATSLANCGHLVTLALSLGWLIVTGLATGFLLLPSTRHVYQKTPV